MLKRILAGTSSTLLTLVLAACGGGSSPGSSSSNNNGYMTPVVNPPAASIVVRTATLSGAQEFPAPGVATSGTGKGALVVDVATHAVTGAITFSGLTGNATAAHIHTGIPGASGGVAIGLTLVNDAGGVPVAAVVPGGTTLTQAQYDALLAGGLYFNVHTAANPGGEIRGQIMGQGGNVAAIASLSGAQEVTPVSTTATGNAALVVDTATMEIIMAAETFSGVVSPTATHIHDGAAGVNGPVIVGLNFGPDAAAGSYVASAPAGAVLTAAQYTDLLAGSLYFNVHSTAYGGGEIRGQVATKTQDAPGMVPTLSSIQADLFTPTCAHSGCHGGPAAQLGLRLDPGYSAGNLINVPSAQDASLTRVIPGDANASLIIQKLEGTQTVGARMPFGGPYLPQATINVVRQWIVVGAPTN